jgi:hypothetical protein
MPENRETSGASRLVQQDRQSTNYNIPYPGAVNDMNRESRRGQRVKDRMLPIDERFVLD